jgi:hypothetical protein
MLLRLVLLGVLHQGVWSIYAARGHHETMALPLSGVAAREKARGTV